MADDLLTQRFDRFNLSARARRAVKDNFGSFEACAESIKHKEVHPRDPATLADFPDLEPTYTLTGWRWGIEFRKPGTGPKTAAEITVATLLLGLVTWEECDFEDTELRLRLFINELLEKNGWKGPLLPGRKSGGKTPEEIEEAKKNKLRERRERLMAEVAKVDNELKAITAKG